MKQKFYCEAPEHIGSDRIVRRLTDQVVVSEDHMSSNGKVRRYRIHLTNLCRQCSDRREQGLRPRGPDTESLFGVKS